MPQKLQPGKEIVHRREAKQTFAELAVSRDRGLEESTPSGAAKTSSWPTVILRAGRVSARHSQSLICSVSSTSTFPACFSQAHAKQPRGDHAAVVQHQHIAFAEQLRQLVKPRVLPCSALPAQGQHAAAPAFGWGLLRDQLWRKLEVEVGDQHRSDCMKATIYPWSGILKVASGGHHGDNNPCSR